MSERSRTIAELEAKLRADPVASGLVHGLAARIRVRPDPLFRAIATVAAAARAALTRSREAKEAINAKPRPAEPPEDDEGVEAAELDDVYAAEDAWGRSR